MVLGYHHLMSQSRVAIFVLCHGLFLMGPVTSFAQSFQQTLANTSSLSKSDESPWQASLISVNLGSRFFWGASGQRKLAPDWSAGLRAGTALDFSVPQGLFSAFGRWHQSARNRLFIEAGLTALLGNNTDSRLFGVGVGTHVHLTQSWRGELMVGYEGIDRWLLRSAFSSWSTARIQIGLIRQL